MSSYSKLLPNPEKVKAHKNCLAFFCALLIAILAMVFKRRR